MLHFRDVKHFWMLTRIAFNFIGLDSHIRKVNFVSLLPSACNCPSKWNGNWPNMDNTLNDNSCPFVHFSEETHRFIVKYCITKSSKLCLAYLVRPRCWMWSSNFVMFDVQAQVRIRAQFQAFLDQFTNCTWYLSYLLNISFSHLDIQQTTRKK